MHISYGDHNGNKKAMLIHYDMPFYAFYLFVSINTVQRSIVPPSDALTVHNSYTGFQALTAFHTYMPTQFL